MSAYYKQVVKSQLVVVSKAELKIREPRRAVEVQMPQDASRGPTRASDRKLKGWKSTKTWSGAMSPF